MTISKFDTRATAQKSALSRLAPTASPTSRVELDNILSSLNAQVTPPLEMRASAVPNLVLNIGAISIQDPEYGYHHTIPPISNLLPTFNSGTITFPSSSGNNAIPSVGDPFLITVSSGQYLKVGVNLDANGNLVLQSGAEGATPAAATNPPLVPNTFPIGFVVLHNVSGTIQNIVNDAIFQYLGGGGGGSGSGDASSVISRLWDKFTDSSYKQLTAVDFSADQDEHVDVTSTGTFSLVSQSFEFSAAAQTLVTKNLLSVDEFLLQEKDVAKVSVSVVWNEEGVDTGASYAISRDGGDNWQTLLMERVGASSDVYEGEHRFTEEATFSALASHGTTNSVITLNATTQQNGAQSFVASAPSVVKKLDLFLTKTGSPSGNIFVAIHRDNAGDPGDILSESQAIPVAGLVTGSNIIDIPAVAINGTSTYWIVIRSDLAYKQSFVNGVTQLAFQVQGSSSGFQTFNGTVWTAGGDRLKYTLLGRELDLRIRVTSSAGSKALIGYGVFYDPESGVIGGTKNIQYIEFLSNTDNENIFTLSFLPDPDLLRVYHVQTGQVYVWPSFSISGSDVIFPAGSFLQENDQLVTLRFVQIEGSTFDNSDSNANKIATLEESQAAIGPLSDQVLLSYLTPVNGSPTTGQFRSSVTNRAKLIDLGNDLMAHMGSYRITTHTMNLVPNEYGPNGESVYKCPNDRFDQVRLVGMVGSTYNISGEMIDVPSNGAYAEVTFWGTGLSCGTWANSGDRSVQVSVDGGAETSVTLDPLTSSTVINDRGYNTNILVNLVSGLTYGLHTVRLRATGSTNRYSFFQIENDSTSLKINPGSALVAGKKRTLSVANISAFNSPFESGVLGTRGGRVLVYMKEDGTIAKAVTPTNAAQANMGSADHSNEEVIRHYWPREFGSDRSTDFATLGASSSSRAFTLEDGSTNLVGNAVYFQGGGVISGYGGEVLTLNASGSYITFTFIGTGLDYAYTVGASGTTNTIEHFVDGTSLGTVSHTSANFSETRVRKVVSGLPYGTHTVKIQANGTYSINYAVINFAVYGPKKPTTPGKALEIADYNILGNFVGDTTASAESISQGVIRKTHRELFYSGTWSFSGGVQPTQISGYSILSSTNGNYNELTFVGTGIDVRFRVDSSSTAQFELDGATNLTSLSPVAVGLGAGGSFTASTGTVSTGSGTNINACLQIQGLAFGKHKIRLTHTSGAGSSAIIAGDVITPIHIHENNGPYLLMNTLPVGSQGLHDRRKFGSQLPDWSKSTTFGRANLHNNVSTSSSSYVATAQGISFYADEDSWYDFDVSAVLNGASASIRPQVSVHLDGILGGSFSRIIAEPVFETINTSGHWVTCSGTGRVWVAKGHHMAAMYLRINGASIIAGETSYIQVRKAAR